MLSGNRKRLPEVCRTHIWVRENINVTEVIGPPVVQMFNVFNVFGALTKLLTTYRTIVWHEQILRMSNNFDALVFYTR